MKLCNILLAASSNVSRYQLRSCKGQALREAEWCRDDKECREADEWKKAEERNDDEE
jgi:hypothetical protein